VHLRDIAQRGVLLSTKANTTEGVSSTTILQSPDAVDTMKALESTCKFWSRWVTTYLERTNIRINLVSSGRMRKAIKLPL
jgi:hypothetical protein